MCLKPVSPTRPIRCNETWFLKGLCKQHLPWVYKDLMTFRYSRWPCKKAFIYLLTLLMNNVCGASNKESVSFILFPLFLSGAISGYKGRKMLVAPWGFYTSREAGWRSFSDSLVEVTGLCRVSREMLGTSDKTWSHSEVALGARRLARPTRQLTPAGHSRHDTRAATQANWAAWELLC